MTTKEALQQLPREIAEKAIRNTIPEHLEWEVPEKYLTAGDRMLGTIIEMAFVWIVTPEGHDYWEAVSNKYRNTPLKLSSK